MGDDAFSLGDSTSLGSFSNQPPDLLLGEPPKPSPPSRVAQQVRQYARRGTHAVLSSIVGVSAAAAVVGGVVLLLVRPAFVTHREKRDRVDLTRVGIWMAIVFAIVALRDQYLQAYRYAMELRRGMA